MHVLLGREKELIKSPVSHITFSIFKLQKWHTPFWKPRSKETQGHINVKLHSDHTYINPTRDHTQET